MQDPANGLLRIPLLPRTSVNMGEEGAPLSLDAAGALAISSVYGSSSRLSRSHNHPSRRPLALPGVLPSGFEATGGRGDRIARTAGVVVGTRRGPGAAGRRGPGAGRGGADQPAAPPRLRRPGPRGGGRLPRR